MASLLERIDVRWILFVLVTLSAATGLGFLVGLWLGS